MNKYKKALHKKTIVITGASSGAGRAIAVELAKRRTRLVLAARREEALKEVATECESLGAETMVIKTDVRFQDSMQDLARAAHRFGGVIDVWINNAGVLAATEFDKAPADLNDEVVKTNLLGYMHGAYAVLPFFKEQGYGVLVNNISVGGWFPAPYAAAYTASKFGIRGFTESLKGELSKHPHIHVCDLYPGFLDTPGIQHAANYTGVALRPAPPVYDPRKVAHAVISLIQNPRPSLTVGEAPVFLKWAYETFPALTRNITAGVIRNYIKNANAIAPTSGNVVEPVDYGRGIDGGWRTPLIPQQTKRKAAFFLSLAAVGLMLFQRK